MDFTEKTVKESLIFDGRILHLYNDEIELPNGKPAMREYIRHQGAVCVVPVTADGKVILVDQYRYPFHTIVREVPAGKLDKGETPEQGARRELEEETGVTGGELTFLGEFYSSPAIMTEVIYMYMATGFTMGKPHTDPDEFVEVVELPLEDAVDAIMRGEIKDSKTQAAVLKTAVLLHKI
ncbi:MAG: NUDIX hydrolase [Clostridia bacterium]|nr:NUDIX hydrolase [Clostridia bacterium]